MRKFLLKSVFIFTAFLAFGQSKPLYQLPESDAAAAKNTKLDDNYFIAGTDSGLYKVNSNGSAVALWTEAKVSQIVRTFTVNQAGNRVSKWFFLTGKGIYTSYDLQTFTQSSSGLPVQKIKEFDGTSKTFVEKVPLLKDLCADPVDQNLLVTATKDCVYITRDGGLTWKSIGSMSKYTGGMKAVAVAHMPKYDSNGTVSGTEPVVFQSHPIYGLSYYKIDAANPAWVDIRSGFENMTTQTYPDEISDVLPVVCKSADGAVSTEIYCAQTFIPRVYRFDWKTKKAVLVYKGTAYSDTIDSLCQTGNEIAFVVPGAVRSLSLSDNSVKEAAESSTWIKLMKTKLTRINAAYVPAKNCGLDTPLQLNELWLLSPNPVLSKYSDSITNRKAIYVPANHLCTASGIAKYKKIIETKKLDSFVVDMKDDYGLLRFEPVTPLVKSKCYVSKYKIDIDSLKTEFKDKGIRMIARIVVFKDKHLSTWDKKQYAIWNTATNTPWVGTRGTENIYDADGNVTGKKTLYYDENWVDPYCEEVWEYNVAIAKELIERGFDEVQFDYIRFPTDGKNMSSAKFRWKDAGMDKESALVSFLSYARKNIDAPIGIDIYGANGWYRSGTRTGQDVELMSEYVDVICPMFYPSHFEQSFMNYEPWTERPYRVYYYGTYRNTVIGRNRIVVRPWVQAFYLGVSYDRQFYNADYVKREVFGVRDGVNRGYMHWNNVGRYDDIPVDPSDDEVYPWDSVEAKVERRPAYSTVNHKFGDKEENAAEVKNAKESSEASQVSSAGSDKVSYTEATLKSALENAYSKGERRTPAPLFLSVSNTGTK